MIDKDNHISIISESVFESTDITILEESAVGSTNSGLKKIRFKAKLQERDVVNNNRRMYSDACLRAITDQLAPKASERKLLGEMDHPTPQGDDKAKLKRSSTIALQNACVLFTSITYDGRFIISECETITGGKGPDLYNFLRDQVVIGFSLRAFGSTQQNPEGFTEVLAENIKALTFDVVSNPSHSNSVIYEILNENSQPVNSYELIKMLDESEQNLVQMDLMEENGILIPQRVDVTNSGFLEESECGCVGDACLVGTIEESKAFFINQTRSNMTNKMNKFSLK